MYFHIDINDIQPQWSIFLNALDYCIFLNQISVIWISNKNSELKYFFKYIGTRFFYFFILTIATVYKF